jgi:Uma2 family endonuclease
LAGGRSADRVEGIVRAMGGDRRITVQEYDRMVERGDFVGVPRIELLAGEIIQKPQPGPRCAESIVSLGELLYQACGTRLRAARQIPILLDDESEPEPDLLVFRPRKWETHLTPGEVLLVVEVADSSIDYDRNRKFPRYAAAGIPEAWLFDVFGAILERHSEPFEGRYRRVEAARRGESLSSTVLPGLTLAVDDILAGGR